MDNNWNTVINEGYAIVSTIQTNNSPSTGLIPDFVVNCNSTPAPAAPNFLESSNDGDYYYNSCRVPWRLATDYLISGEVRSKSAVNKINLWLQNHTSSNPANIMAGYTLSGGNISGNNYDDPSFIGPFAVGAMLDSLHPGWLNGLYDHLIAQDLADNTYFGNTLKMLSLIVLSGNYWPPNTVSQVEINPDNLNMSIFPNPAKDFIQISLNGRVVPKPVVVTILNFDGKIIKTVDNCDMSFIIDISSLTSGVYILKLQSDNCVVTKKIFKE